MCGLMHFANGLNPKWEPYKSQMMVAMEAELSKIWTDKGRAPLKLSEVLRRTPVIQHHHHNSIPGIMSGPRTRPNEYIQAYRDHPPRFGDWKEAETADTELRALVDKASPVLQADDDVKEFAKV